MDDCAICCKPFTQELRKPICCKYCNHTACLSCIKTYLLSIVTDSKCMNCNVAWDYEFITLILSRSFVTKQLKEHRENLLLQREKSLLPDTLGLVDRTLQRRKLMSDIDELMQRKQTLIEEINTINTKVYDLRYDLTVVGNKKIEQIDVVRPCPAVDCRGFLSSKWKCGVCSIKVCHDCHEIQTSDHECKPEDVETAKLLKKDSKNCPKCGVIIHKYIGCDQVWCPQCHCAFNWKTCKIETGPVHNPHYYEWLRTQNNGEIPRNFGDVPCDENLPTFWVLNNYLKTVKVKFEYYLYHRAVLHFREVEIQRLQPRYTDNSDLRVRYLLNEISDEYFKKEIHKREVKAIRSQSYREVYQMMVAVGTDLTNKILKIKSSEEADNLHKEFENLRHHYNQSIEQLNKRYKSIVDRSLDEKWIVR